MPRVTSNSATQLTQIISTMQSQLRSVMSQPTSVVVDNQGTIFAQLGLITLTDSSQSPLWGLVVRNPEGELQMLSGRAAVFTSSTVLSGVSGSGNVPGIANLECRVGPSGVVDLDLGSTITLEPSAAGIASAQLNITCSDSSIDVHTTAFFSVVAAASGVGWGQSVAARGAVSGLTPGDTYGFTLTWSTNGNGTASYINPYLVVSPA